MTLMVFLFDDALKNKKTILFDGVKINFTGFSDLLKVKETAGRPQDLADISKLKSRNQKK